MISSSSSISLSLKRLVNFAFSLQKKCWREMYQILDDSLSVVTVIVYKQLSDMCNKYNVKQTVKFRSGLSIIFIYQNFKVTK